MPDRRPTPARLAPARPARAGHRDAGAGRGDRARTELPDGPVPIDTGTVQVERDRGDPRSLTVLVNGVPSSPVHLDDPSRLDFEYLQQMAAILERTGTGPLDAVHLGAGACALPRWLQAVRPGSHQVAVDVDARLLTLVRQWFDLPRSPLLRLRPGDARAVLTALPADSADVVVRDVFAGDVTPRDLTTLEFTRQVARVLRPGGLYLANCADRPPLALARAEVATVQEVMAEVALAVEPGVLRGRRYGNLVLAATTAPGGAPGGDGLARALRSLPVPVRLLRGTELAAFVAGARARRDPELTHDVLTTQAAPP